MSGLDPLRISILSVLDQVQPALVKRSWIVSRMEPELAVTESQFSEVLGQLILDGEIVVADHGQGAHALYSRAEGRVTPAPPPRALPLPKPRPSRAAPRSRRHRTPGELRELILRALSDRPMPHFMLAATQGLRSSGVLTTHLGQLARDGLIERVDPTRTRSAWQLKGQRSGPAADIEIVEAYESMRLPSEPDARQAPATPAFAEDEFATLVSVPGASRFAVFSDGQLQVESPELRIVFPPAVTSALINYLDKVCALTVRGS